MGRCPGRQPPVSSSLLLVCPPAPLWACCVRESAALYRPRRPERTSYYALLERHFEDYTRVHSERYAAKHGMLRRVVRRCVEQFLDCGRYASGFARLRCANCQAEHLIDRLLAQRRRVGLCSPFEPRAPPAA